MTPSRGGRVRSARLARLSRLATVPMVMTVAASALLAGAGCATFHYEEDDEQRGVHVGTEVSRETARSADTLDRSVPPAVGAPRSMRLPEVVEFELANGIPVVLVERRGLPVVEVELQFPGGASSPGSASAGLAALTADMLDEGTESRSALEIAAAVDRLGASLYTGASWDASSVEMGMLAPHLDEALEILADVVMSPAFDPMELERVREERLNRILQNLDEPRALADNAFIEVLYGADHPYGSPLLGTRASVEALTREQVVAFRAERYTPENARLLVVGDVDEAELRAALEPHLARWGSDPAAGRVDGAARTEEAGRTEPSVGMDEQPQGGAATAEGRPEGVGTTIHLVDRPGSAQSEIRIGRIGVSRATEEYFPLTILNTVLGGSFTSRLNSRLREEKGYTYGAFSSFAMRRAPGPFVAQAAVSTPVTDSALVVFLEELRAIREEAVPADELERAKSYVALRLPQRFETVSDVASRLSELLLYGLPLDFYGTFVERTMAVTAEEVRDAARRWLSPDDLVIVIAGDVERIEEPLRALGIGRIVHGPAPARPE